MINSPKALLIVLCLAAGAMAEEAPRRPGEESAPRPLTDELAGPEWAANRELDFPIRFSGYLWNDTGYMRRTNAQSGQPDQDAAYMQGRFVLGGQYARAFGSVSALARVELMGLINELAKGTYEPHTLDAYLKVGQKWWDFQIGRFLAWEVYYRGQGIELYTAEEAGALQGTPMYLLDYTRGLLNEAGQAAVHFYSGKWLSFELAGAYGQQSNQNWYGGRPVVDVKLGGFELIGGAEILRQAPQTSADKVVTTSKGYAARLQYTLPFLVVGADGSRTAVDVTDIQGLTDTAKTLDKTSVGGFADITPFKSHLIGLGLHYTTQTNRRGENNTHVQSFVSWLYQLPIEGLSVKAVYGFARAHVQDFTTTPRTEWDNNMNSVRVRILYEFR